jgi:hypothetical protein
MSGVKGPTSKDGKLTPKGAALKRWRCSKALEIYEQLSEQAQDMLMKSESMQQKFKDALEKAGRCWEGYEPTPGKKPYSEGSCRPAKKSKEGVSSKIRELRAEGVLQEQAVATALNMEREGRLTPAGKYKRVKKSVTPKEFAKLKKMLKDG